MSNYKERSDYFKMLARNNKLIAHDQPVSEGSSKLRKSFHRVNDLDELNAACVNWAHFPCVVHVGHDITYKQPETGLPRKVIGNHLLFLSKTSGQNLADSMELAYQEAEEAMSEFLGWMNEEMQENKRCCELFLFDLNRAHAEQDGPYNSVLYGWHLTFYDEIKAYDFCYKQEDWFDPLDAEQDCDCGCGDGNGNGGAGDGEIIFFYDETFVDIPWTDERKAKLGQLPIVQVWFKNATDEYTVAYTPIVLTGTPPLLTNIRVYNGGSETGMITLKKTV